MANKELVVTATDIAHISVSENALKAYDFLQNNIPAMDADELTVQNFIHARNCKMPAIRDLWEVKAYLKLAYEAIEDVCKHSFNVGTIDDLPKEAKWKSGGTTKTFADGAGAIVADALVKKHLVTKEQLFNLLKPTDVAKAAGVKADKLIDMFPDTIIEKEKACSLTIV